MSRREGVVNALARFRITGQTAVTPEIREISAPTGKQFVNIRLMPDVKYEAVTRCVEDPVQRHRQFYYAEV